MVHFETNKLIIEIETDTPAESWIDLQQGLCDIVRSVDNDTLCPTTFFRVIDFIGELVPELSQAKKMQNIKKAKK